MNFLDTTMVLQSAKALMNSLGLESEEMNVVIFLIFFCVSAYKVTAVTARATVGAYRWLSPKDAVADSLIKSINEECEWFDKTSELITRSTIIKVKTGKKLGVEEIQSVAAGGRIIFKDITPSGMRRVLKLVRSVVREKNEATLAASRAESVALVMGK